MGDASRDTGDPEIVLGLLTSIERDSRVTQRKLAGDLGIALGLANAYLRRCVRKGLVKVSQVPLNRYAYYLRPSISLIRSIFFVGRGATVPIY
jgi:ribosomal protein S25